MELKKKKAGNGKVTPTSVLNSQFCHNFREDYLKVVTVPIDASITLLTRILSVTNDSLVSYIAGGFCW